MSSTVFTANNLLVKEILFTHTDIHKHTWASPVWKTHNWINHILIDRRRHLSIRDVQSFRGADCDTDHCLVFPKVGERLIVSKQENRCLMCKDLISGS